MNHYLFGKKLHKICFFIIKMKYYHDKLNDPNGLHLQSSQLPV